MGDPIDELPPSLRQSIISGTAGQTQVAFAVAVGMRLQPDLDAMGMTFATEPDLLVNEPHKMLYPVQNRLNFELNSWSPGLIFPTD